MLWHSMGQTRGVSYLDGCKREFVIFLLCWKFTWIKIVRVLLVAVAETYCTYICVRDWNRDCVMDPRCKLCNMYTSTVFFYNFLETYSVVKSISRQIFRCVWNYGSVLCYLEKYSTFIYFPNFPVEIAILQPRTKLLFNYGLNYRSIGSVIGLARRPILWTNIYLLKVSRIQTKNFRFQIRQLRKLHREPLW